MSVGRDSAGERRPRKRGSAWVTSVAPSLRRRSCATTQLTAPHGFTSGGRSSSCERACRRPNGLGGDGGACATKNVQIVVVHHPPGRLGDVFPDLCGLLSGVTTSLLNREVEHGVELRGGEETVGRHAHAEQLQGVGGERAVASLPSVPSTPSSSRGSPAVAARVSCRGMRLGILSADAETSPLRARVAASVLRCAIHISCT